MHNTTGTGHTNAKQAPDNKPLQGCESCKGLK